MNLIKTLREIFGKSKNLGLTSPISSNIEQRISNHWDEVEVEALKMIEHYGNDFEDFFYRSDFSSYLRTDVLEFRSPLSEFNKFLDNDHWANRNPFNFPGPFYTGESDTCGTGVCEAPKNVLNDRDNCEYIFRQPKTYSEFLCVVDAAAIEVLDSWSCNGNEYWTYEKCKLWWRNKSDLVDKVSNIAGSEPYIEYLNSLAELDLRKYCYFLENHNYPDDDSILPGL